MTIKRLHESNRLDVTDDVATTEALNVSEYAFGSFHVPTTSSITTITWHGNCHPDGEFGPISTPVMDVAGGGTYRIPDAVMSCHSVKAVGDVAGDIMTLTKG